MKFIDKGNKWEKSPEDCKRRCVYTKECKAWLYYKEDCFMWEDVTISHPIDGAISGNKTCGECPKFLLQFSFSGRQNHFKNNFILPK